MLAANARTRALLSGGGHATVRDYAEAQSLASIRRFTDRMNAVCDPALRYEYDGRIVRCLVLDPQSLFQRLRQRETSLVTVDPLHRGITAWFRKGIEDDRTIWWHDLGALQAHYESTMEKVLPLITCGRDRLCDVPVVIGGDWEFNAWACPAGDAGDFIMVNSGFIHSYSYAAMFLRIAAGPHGRELPESSPDVIASSMLWMAGVSLGRPEFGWDNLSLPWEDCDAVWESVQRPSERLTFVMNVIDAFTMLHECGHVALGHMDRFRTWRIEDDLDRGEAHGRYVTMRAFEYEADRFACEALLSPDPNAGSAFLEPLLILFTMLRLCEGGAPPLLSSTHPTAGDRFRACLGALNLDQEREFGWLERFFKLFVEAAKRRLAWQATLPTTDDGNT